MGAGGGGGWPLGSKAASAGTISADAAPASPRVRRDPRKVCSGTVAPFECSAFKTVEGRVSVFFLFCFFLPVNCFSVFIFYIFTLLPVNLVFRH